jgi:hypothetical protein
MFVRFAFKNVKKLKGWSAFWSKAIAWFTLGQYSHVEVWFSGEASAARCFSSREGRGASFGVVDLSRAYDYIELTADIETVDKAYKAAQSLDGYGYDWLGLSNFMLKLGIHHVHDVFCSEAAFTIAQETNLLHSSEQGYKITPQELADLVEVKYGSLVPLYPCESPQVSDAVGK